MEPLRYEKQKIEEHQLKSKAPKELFPHVPFKELGSFWNRFRTVIGKDITVTIELEGKQQVVSINVDALANCLHLSPKEVKNLAYEGRLEKMLAKEHIHLTKSLIDHINTYRENIKKCAALINLSEETLLKTAYIASSTTLENGTTIVQLDDFPVVIHFEESVEAGIKPEIAVIDLSKEIASGSFGTIHDVVTSLGTEYVFKRAKTHEKNYEINIAQVRNESFLLNKIHKNGIVTGIQLPPHRILHHTKEGQKLTGYMGHYYDRDLSQMSVSKNLEDRKEVIKQLAIGLHNIHKLDIRHGDIKTENIFVKIKRYDIADFGGAQTFENLKNIFDQCYQNLQKPGISQAFKEHMLENYALTLTGIYSPSYSTVEDHEKIKSAILNNNWEMYKEIELKRDVYSLGMTFIDHFYGEYGREATHITGMLPDLIIKYFKKELGFSDQQIDILNRMVSFDTLNRPSSSEVDEAFNSL